MCVHVCLCVCLCVCVCVLLSTAKHGDCFSAYGQIRANVGLLRCWTTEVPLQHLPFCNTRIEIMDLFCFV